MKSNSIQRPLVGGKTRFSGSKRAERQKTDKTRDSDIIASERPLAKRSEILFFYDARMCNPNGDPDENRPRIDRITKKNLVTEFRLKRTIRDYLYHVMDKTIFIRQEPLYERGLGLKAFEDLAVNFIKYYKKVKDKNGREQYIEIPKKTYKENDRKNYLKTIDRNSLLREHIDIRLFGILFAVPGIHFKQIGPAQFSIGQSLNEIDEDIQIRMTRIVPNTKQEVEQEQATEPGELRASESGTFGEKYILRYSFIQFHGFVNDNVAHDAKLSENDVYDMLTAMWNGTDSMSTSSKFGQKSRLVIKVNYKDEGYIGDLDLMCKLEKKIDDGRPLENISQVKLNLQRLIDVLRENHQIIGSIEYKSNSELLCSSDSNNEGTFEEIVRDLNKKEPIIKISRLNL